MAFKISCFYIRDTLCRWYKIAIENLGGDASALPCCNNTDLIKLACLHTELATASEEKCCDPPKEDELYMCRLSAKCT